jgi:aryl carrier-like protein
MLARLLAHPALDSVAQDRLMKLLSAWRRRGVPSRV